MICHAFAHHNRLMSAGHLQLSLDHLQIGYANVASFGGLFLLVLLSLFLFLLVGLGLERAP